MSRKASMTEKRLLEEPTWRKKPAESQIPDLSSVIALAKGKAQTMEVVESKLHATGFEGGIRS